MIAFASRASAVLYELLRRGGRPYLIPANVCPVVPVTFLEARRAFEFVDVSASTLEINLEACADLVRRQPNRFGGILFVRPYGRDRNVDPFFQRLKEIQPDLFVIDDKCLCRPDCQGSGVSPWADATLFSTGHVKHVDVGFGGFAHIPKDMVSVPPVEGHKNPDVAERAETCRYKSVADYAMLLGPRDGWLDLSEPQMCWEDYRRNVLEELPKADEQKRRLNRMYAEMLPTEIQLAPEFQSWRFNIRVPESERLVARLFAQGLFASRHYASLAGPDEQGHYPVIERLHGEVVNLFNDRYFDEQRAERTAHVVLEHLSKGMSGWGQ